MKNLIAAILMLFSSLTFAQKTNLQLFNKICGEWQGQGDGYSEGTSEVSCSIAYTMGGTYLEIKGEAKFKPTEKNPKGEHHIDQGFISFDKKRKTFVFRQFHIEGFVNQYIMDNETSSDSVFVFNSESIENFVDGGKARVIIELKADGNLQSAFYLSMPGQELSCYGNNVFTRKP